MASQRFTHGIRLLSIALEPALLIAERCNFSLDEFTQAAQRAYFRRLQSKGHSLGTIARILRRSKRATVAMSNRFREGQLPPALSRRNVLELRLMAALTPSKRLCKSDHTDEQWQEYLDAAIGLEAHLGLEVSENEITCPKIHFSADDDLERQVVGLHIFFQSVCAAIEARYFDARQQKPFARIGVLRMKAQGNQQFSDKVFATVLALGEEEESKTSKSDELADIAIVVACREDSGP